MTISASAFALKTACSGDEPPAEKPIYDQKLFLALAAKGKDEWNKWRRDPANKDVHVIFADVDFCEARDQINFEGFELGDRADFSGCKWQSADRANFNGAAFRDDASFNGATFGLLASFNGVAFRDYASFNFQRRCSFERKVQRAVGQEHRKLAGASTKACGTRKPSLSSKRGTRNYGNAMTLGLTGF